MIEPIHITSKEILNQLPAGFHNGLLGEEEREGILLGIPEARAAWEIKLRKNGSGIKLLVKFATKDDSPVVFENREIFARELLVWRNSALTDELRQLIYEAHPRLG